MFAKHLQPYRAGQWNINDLFRQLLCTSAARNWRAPLTGSNQLKVADGANDIDASLTMPINRTMTALTYGRIAVRSGHVVGKATFINIDDWTPAALSGVLKLTALALIGFGVAQRFFYG